MTDVGGVAGAADSAMVRHSVNHILRIPSDNKSGTDRSSNGSVDVRSQMGRNTRIECRSLRSRLPLV